MSLLGILLGSVAGFRSLFRYTRRAAERQEREDRAEREGQGPPRTSDTETPDHDPSSR